MIIIYIVYYDNDNYMIIIFEQIIDKSFQLIKSIGNYCRFLHACTLSNKCLNYNIVSSLFIDSYYSLELVDVDTRFTSLLNVACLGTIDAIFYFDKKAVRTLFFAFSSRFSNGKR